MDMQPHGGRSRAGKSGFELWTWFFMRISGILLVFLVLGHIYVMHISNSVHDINYQFVAEQWMSPFWRIWDLLMLILALVHGTNGVRYIIDDYVSSRGWRLTWRWTVYTIAFVLLIGGAVVLLTFEPV